MKPILCSTPMVQAILEGHKTMTRRVFKNPIKRYVGYRSRVAELLDDSSEPLSEKEFYEVYSPYHKGDILWVRETWYMRYAGGLIYKADGDLQLPDDKKWKPSIHMPRSAARIFLEVKSVRVERLQGLSEEDARADHDGCPRVMSICDGKKVVCNFARLWDTINAKRGYSWDSKLSLRGQRKDELRR